MSQIKIGYLGPTGTYSHEAALKVFSQGHFVPQSQLADVVSSVADKQVDFAVLPIENSSNGAVVPALQALELKKDKVYIHGDVYVSICHSHYTFGRQETVRLYSHPQVWGQIQGFLKMHTYQLVDCSSTVAALEQAKSDPQGAAVASVLGGQMTGLEPSQTDINDSKSNKTRFVVLSSSPRALSADAAATTSRSVFVHGLRHPHDRVLDPKIPIAESDPCNVNDRQILGVSGPL